MNEEQEQDFKAEIVKAALRDLCEYMVEVAQQYNRQELTETEYLALIREADDMASNIRGLE